MLLKQIIHKLLIVIVLFFQITQLFCQTADTIYVYETVHVTDTVWLEVPVERDTTRIYTLESIQNATLLLDTLNQNATLIYFTSKKSATIPINRIYVNRNQLNQTKMKNAGFFTLMFLAFQSISFAQLPSELNHYSIGIGVGNENNVSNYGLWFSNDYKMYLLKRIAVNPRIGFFQSTGSFESGIYGYKSNSGIMFDCGLSYSVVNKAKSNLSINLGPSFEIGSETHLGSATFSKNVVVTEKYVNNQLSRWGYYLDIEYSLKQNERIWHSIGIKSSSYEIFAEYLGIVYKIGLKR